MVKRVFDLVAAGVGLLVLSPVFLIVGILVKLDSPGPVLYRGDRIGKDGVPFKMYKFRTMVVNADQMGSALTHGGDPRVTRVGRFLRQWKLDEIPQLINVVRGEMSFVGPRPESPGYVEYYTPEQRQVLQVKPGITGLTQVKFRHEETLLSRYTNREEAYIGTIMPQKLALDLEYVENHTFRSDLALIVRTFRALFMADQVTDDADGMSKTSSLQDA
jgi:lipopolysaccharide/colanic/teichoic acid biosynthesis glycosyltransferase